MYFIGIDHHKQASFMTVLDEAGQELKKGRMLNTKRDIERFLEGYRPFTAALEAGLASYEMADLLRDLGGEVKIAHAYQMKAIAQARIKTDKRDSKVLAEALRLGMIPEIYQRGVKNRQGQRAYWVAKQTEVKNKIRALLSHQPEEIRLEGDRRGDGLFSGKGVAFMTALPLEDPDKKILDDLLLGYQELQAHLKTSDELAGRLYQEIKEASLIDTVPGFGRTLSVLVAVEIADIHRFATAADLHSYPGVIPSTYSSGQRTVHGHLTKQGNPWLRGAAVEAVHPAIQKDLGLRVLYTRLAKRKGSNVAKIAVARRLLTIIFRLLTERKAYIPDMSKLSAA
jgi:transposase